MNEKQYNAQMNEEVIDLRELFIVLWRKKITIISITLIAAIITGLISVFLIAPVYHAKLNIIINMPDAYNTKYGEYSLPIKSNEEYINLITSNEVLLNAIEDLEYDDEIVLEDFRKKITIGFPEVTNKTTQNTFFVKVSADNPKEAQKLAKTLYYNYIEFLDVLTIGGALDYHISRFNLALQTNEISLSSAREMLLKNEALLSETPQTINQKEAMDEIQASNNTSDFIILERVINPNYTKIENDIIENKQTINNIENSIRVYNEYLSELYELKDKFNNYKSSSDYTKLENDFILITKTHIYLPSEPIAPSKKTSPSNTKNVIIGALLGGVVAVGAVLIHEYWIKPYNEAEEQ